jgi:hypothetical protein
MFYFWVLLILKDYAIYSIDELSTFFPRAWLTDCLNKTDQFLSHLIRVMLTGPEFRIYSLEKSDHTKYFDISYEPSQKKQSYLLREFMV